MAIAPEERSFEHHGVRYVYDRYLPSTTPRAAVQLLHGVGEHAGRYTALASALAAEGYLVYADDHLGHGRTGLAQHGTPERLGRLGRGGIPAAVDAVSELTSLIRAENPGLPLVLIGHSWGSFLAQLLVNRHADAYDALVLSGSALRWPGSLNGGDLNAPWKHEDASGVAWLSRDTAVQQAFLADPLTTTTPLIKLFGVRNALRLFGKPGRDLSRKLPTLLMVGSDDTVGGPESIERLAEAYRDRSGFTDVTTIVYPGARHEIFNELNQAEVRADLIAWLDARLPIRD